MTGKFELLVPDIMILLWKWSSQVGAESPSVKWLVQLTWSRDVWILKSNPNPVHLWSYRLLAQ